MKRKRGNIFKQKIENVVGENKKLKTHLYTIQIRYIIFIHLETCTSLFFFVDHILIIDNIYNNNLNSHILLYSYRS